MWFLLHGYSGEYCEIPSSTSIVTYVLAIGGGVGAILIGVGIYCYRRRVAKRNDEHAFALMTN